MRVVYVLIGCNVDLQNGGFPSLVFGDLRSVGISNICVFGGIFFIICLKVFFVALIAYLRTTASLLCCRKGP